MNGASTSIGLELLMDAVKAELGGIAGVLAVYLHGSAARDSLRPDSDIDLAVLVRQGCSLPSTTRKASADALAYRLGRTVDLGELSSSNLVFAAEVLFRGKQLFVSDKDAAAARAADLLSLYVRFNEDRREVLDAYRAG